jgi:hypothetical protein
MMSQFGYATAGGLCYQAFRWACGLLVTPDTFLVCTAIFLVLIAMGHSLMWFWTKYSQGASR